ncbi:hypothetical protein O5626_29440, partial [Escherichia coli]|nr:hypothetical protein [Escherichia coli]
FRSEAVGDNSVTKRFNPGILRDINNIGQIQVEGLRRLREILQTQGLNIEALFRE